MESVAREQRRIHHAKKSVKPTVTPDSVHTGLPPHVTTINLGPWSPKGSVLPTRQLRGPRSGRGGEPLRFALAYLVLLRVEIARFTRGRLPRRDSSLLL